MTVATHVVTADFSGFANGARLSANVTITDNLRGVAVSDDSVGFVHGVIHASVDNNVLLDQARGTGVELTSNDPALNLTGALQYTFSFNDVKIDGVYVPNAIPDIVYNAPADGTAVDLIAEAPAAWVTVVGLLEIAAANILDATAIGRQILTAANAAAVSTLLGVATADAAVLTTATGRAIAFAIALG
jgi:hypothetical protein